MEPSKNIVTVTSKGYTRMRGQTSDILYAFSLMTVPLAVFTGLLLGLIFKNRVIPNDSVYGNLKLLSNNQDSGVIYVEISATTLTTIASWSSTVAPILVGCAVSLASYPVARRMLHAGIDDRPKELPTPFQLSVMLQVITNGSPGALWKWLKYSWGWRGKKEPQGGPMKMLVAILVFGLMLSAFVFAADTWFHFETKSVLLTQVQASSSQGNRSVGLLPDCYNVQSPYATGCTLNPAGTATFIMNGQDTLAVLANVSSTMQVNTIQTGANTVAYVGNPPTINTGPVDYTAYTWGVETQCAPVTPQCVNEDDISGVATEYLCPFAMEGTLLTPKENVMAMAYFTDSSGQNNDTLSVSLQNPYYFAAIVAVNQNFGHGPAEIKGDPNVFSTTHGADLFVVYCNATVYDIEYSLVNGTVARFTGNKSNNTMANIVQGAQQYTEVGDANILQGASIGALIGRSAQDIADYFALTYSQVAISLATAAFTSQAPLEAQLREDKIVARVPIAPLACLLLSNMLLVILGIILTIVAFIAGRDDTREVQARLSIPSVVAALFEGNRFVAAMENVEDAFEERRGIVGPRVGVSRSEAGGWKFASWQPY